MNSEENKEYKFNKDNQTAFTTQYGIDLNTLYSLYKKKKEDKPNDLKQRCKKCHQMKSLHECTNVPCINWWKCPTKHSSHIHLIQKAIHLPSIDRSNEANIQLKSIASGLEGVIGRDSLGNVEVSIQKYTNSGNIRSNIKNLNYIFSDPDQSKGVEALANYKQKSSQVILDGDADEDVPQINVVDTKLNTGDTAKAKGRLYSKVILDEDEDAPKTTMVDTKKLNTGHTAKANDSYEVKGIQITNVVPIKKMVNLEEKGVELMNKLVGIRHHIQTNNAIRNMPYSKYKEFKEFLGPMTDDIYVNTLKTLWSEKETELNKNKQI